jgi:ANTAR domain
VRTAPTAGGTGAQDAGADVERLRDEVAGLRRAMETRGQIEQAKGVLMQRHGWTAEQAFRHLVRLSQHSNIRLATLAELVVAEVASPRSVEPGAESLAYRLLDHLGHPAMIVRPVSADAAVSDFHVDYANPVTVDVDGRTADQLVGRRLSKLYPNAPANGILAACTAAWRSASSTVHTQDVSVRDDAGQARNHTLRLQAVPFLDRLLVTW